MRIKVIGKAHLQGASRKTGKPYNFIQVHYNGAAFGVEGVAACTLSLDPQQYPYDRTVQIACMSVSIPSCGIIPPMPIPRRSVMW